VPFLFHYAAFFGPVSMKERRMETVGVETTYKSRPKLLQRFFLRSRNQWKAKCRGAKRELKLARNQIRAVQHSRAGWKARAQQLAAELQAARQQVEELQSKNGRQPRG
jgi:hypothetical protein